MPQDEAPGAAWKVPTGQLVHCVAAAAEKVPAAHALHFPFNLYRPALQTSGLHELWPTEMNDPPLEGQLGHSFAPAAPENLPAAHAVQPLVETPVALLNCPAGQFMHWVPPDVFLYVPDGQATQDLAPAEAAIKPAEHTTHAAEPVAEANVPAAQEIHWVPPTVSLKVPAAQAGQTFAPALEEVPLAHAVQPEEAVLPAN